MSTTIDSLDIQIKASAGSATANIDALASSLANLNKSVKLTKATNNINKLAAALNTLQASSPGISAIRELGAAMGQLSQVSGLSRAINSLKKIPDITANLDKTTLTDFAAKMQALAAALSPLAEKISIVAAGFSKLPSQVSKTVTATNRMAKASMSAASAQSKHNATLNKFQINLAAGIANIRSAIHAMRAMVTVVSSFMSEAIEWDGIQFRFGRAFAEEADEVYEYVQRISDGMKINLQELMQYSSMYGSLLKGFGVEQSKVTTMSIGLTEMTYDIWAANNDRYKTVNDAYEAVRSAITGEIEPIRNAGIALTQASMQEYLDSIGLAHIKVAQLSEAQKSEVRYATMVNSALEQGIVGTYATEMKTAEGAVRTLSQQLKGLAQALGSLVLPAFSAIIPYITAFVRVIYSVAAAIASLFKLPFFSTSWGNTTGGLDGVTDSANDATDSLNAAGGAAAALKDYTMGFDELNVIKPDTGGGGGADTGGLDWEGLDNLETLWDDSIFASVSEKVDELVPKMEKILTFATLIGGAIALWKIVPAFITGLDTVRAVLSGLAGNRAAISALTFMGKPELATQTAIWATAISKVGGALSTAATAVATFIGGLSGGAILIIVAIITAIASAAYFLYQNWDKVAQAVKDFFEQNIAQELGEIKEHWGKLKEAAEKARDALLEAVPPELREALEKIGEKIGDVITQFKNWIKKAEPLEVIGTIFETIGGIVVGVVGGAIAGAINGLVSVIENAIEIISGIGQIFSGVIQFVVALFTGGDVGAAWQTLWDGVVQTASGLWGLLTEPIGAIVQGLLGWWDSLLSNTTTWWGKVKSWFNSKVKPKFTLAYWQGVFSKIKTALGEKLEEVKEKAAEIWGKIKDWYDSKVAPFFTLEFWQEVLDTIRQAVEEKLRKVEEKWSEIWDSIIDWYETNIGPVFTLEYWQAAFDSIREAIEEKLGAAETAWSTTWEAIKTWYSTNIAPMFTAEYWQGVFDSIRSGLQTKLDEAWTAISNFFSVEAWKQKINAAMQTIRDNFKIPSLPSIGLNVTFDSNVSGLRKKIADALGLDGWPRLSWYSIPAYAAGGFPDMGEMFIAREAGPELVGRIGNKTTVANNDQIVEAVSKGVYSAVVAAMSGQGGSQDMHVNVYLDGQQLYASFKKTESERGVSLMGNQLGYTY